MDKPWGLLNKTLVIVIIILLLGVAISPCINTTAYQDSNEKLITVDFIGLDYNKSYSTNVSYSDFIEIRNMLDEKEKTLSNEPLETMKYVYEKLETFGLMEKNDSKSLFDSYKKIDDFEKILKSNKLIQNSNDFSNIFCYLILHIYTASRIYENGLLTFLGLFLMISGYIILSGNFIFLAYGLAGIGFLMLFSSYIYNGISPLRFWNWIESDSPNDLYSIGLKGSVNLFDKLIDIFGFRGIRISLPDINESYFIGHATVINVLVGG